MKPEFIAHDVYQVMLLDRLRSYYGPFAVFVGKDWPLVSKFWITDLSYVTPLIRDQYSHRGPEPQDPASMLRSYLLFLMTHPEKGLTEWVNILHRTPLYAMLSGFASDQLPGVGTFYDFFPRLWAAIDKNHKPQKHARRKGRAKKGKKKGEKAPTTSAGKIKRLVQWMERHMNKQKALPTDRLFHFFQTQILSVSARYGLLGNLDAMGIAGDGTPVVTAAYTRSKPSCDCHAQGLADCHHPRIYSQPDCNSGWDSAREKYYNGYDLYMISATDSPHDLPLYPRLHPASRHDAVSLVASAVEFKQRFTLGMVDKMLLDAAHDAEAIYQLLDRQHIEPFIDLNQRKKKNTPAENGFKISPKGIPLCPKGKEMHSNGYDHAQDRQKWRCAPDCPCNNGTKYGRTYHTYPKGNLRLFPKTLRDSPEWKTTYKRRTSIERSNKREKVDYKLESGRHRSTMMWYMRVYSIMICQHMDAWYEHRKEALKELPSFILPTAM